jgi:hypothetical protein
LGKPQRRRCLRISGLRTKHHSIEEIVAATQGGDVPEKPDARMLVCYMLAGQCEEEQMQSPCIVTYMERLPKEFATIFARAATQARS